MTAVKTRKAARKRLQETIRALCMFRGSAEWTDGYRTAKGEPLEAEMLEKSKRQWNLIDRAQRAVERAITAYGRASRVK